MNEYLALELIRQRTTERREEARQASLVHRLRLARRQRNRDEALVQRTAGQSVHLRGWPGALIPTRVRHAGNGRCPPTDAGRLAYT